MLLALLAFEVLEGIGHRSPPFPASAPVRSGRPLAWTYAWTGAAAAAWLALTAAGLLGWLYVSHVFLRRRIAWVLRARGRCAGCGYVLAGLPVDDACRVVCPECETEAVVDRSLGELARGDDGRVRYAPSEETLKRSAPWLTAVSLRKWGKRVGLVVGLLALFVGIVGGLNEWRVRSQAARAALLRPGAADVEAVLERGQLRPGVSAEPVNALDLIGGLVGKMSRIEGELFPEGLPVVEGVQVYVDGTSIAARLYPDQSDDSKKELRVSEPVNLRVLEAYRRAGVFDDARAIADADVAIARLGPGGDAPLLRTYLGANYGGLRRLARWEGARMRLAVRTGDARGFAEALDNALGYGQACEGQPELIGPLVAVAIESFALGELRAAIRERPDAAWLDAAEAVLKKRSRHVPASLPLEAERLLTRDYVCWVFSDPARARLGRYSPALHESFRAAFQAELPEGSLGSLEANLAEVDRIYGGWADAVKKDRGERTAVAQGPTRLVLVDALTPALDQLQRSMDQVRIDRVATPLLLALERFRLAHGAYPRALSELAPKYVPAVPSDPWTGRPFGYRVVYAKADPQGRGFVLYSIGTDLVDNGGVNGGRWFEALHGQATAGKDYIINDAER